MDNTTRGPAGEREQQAKRLYVTMTDNDPIVHSNRFPSWEELSQIDRDVWIAKVPVTPVASHLPESGPMEVLLKELSDYAWRIRSDWLELDGRDLSQVITDWIDRARAVISSLPHSERDEVLVEIACILRECATALRKDDYIVIPDQLCFCADRLSVPEHLRSFTCPRCLTPETITPAEASPTGYSCVQCGYELPVPEHRTTKCDCGDVLTECYDCCVSTYQSMHPECPHCCAKPGELAEHRTTTETGHREVWYDGFCSGAEWATPRATNVRDDIEALEQAERVYNVKFPPESDV